MMHIPGIKRKKVDNGECVTEVVSFTDLEENGILNQKKNTNITKGLCVLATKSDLPWVSKFKSGGLPWWRSGWESAC